MAKLPHGERAVIPMEKLTHYCLNPSHPRGKDKARVFASVLGLTQDRADELYNLVRQASVHGEVTKQEQTVFGRYYRVDWPVPAQAGVILRTIWQFAPGEETPRMISVFLR